MVVPKLKVNIEQCKVEIEEGGGVSLELGIGSCLFAGGKAALKIMK